MDSSERIDVGEGVILTPSTQEDFDIILANLRDMDRAEAEVFGGADDNPEDMDQSWTIRDGDAIIGFLATKNFELESYLSPRRFLVELTTKEVWKRKVKYVKYSRRVLKAVVANTPAWVTDFYTLPLKAYVGACKWDERVLGMHKVREIDYGEYTHVLYKINRNEVLG